MKTALISMVRNEIDIIDVWIQHQLAFHDFIFCVDHRSDDGTGNYLIEVSKKFPSLQVFHYKERSYDQDHVFKHMRNLAVSETDAEWLFFLDADEFLPYRNQEEFKEAISSVQSYDVLTFPWRNGVPIAPVVKGLEFSGFRQTRPSEIGKIVIRRNIAADDNYYVPKGAHKLQHRVMGTINGFDFNEVHHLPCRSIDQICAKILNGCLSYLHDPHYDGRQGRHWFDILNQLLTKDVTWDDAHAFVYNYGEKDTNLAGRLNQSRVDNNYFEAHDYRFAGLESSDLSLFRSLPPARPWGPTKDVSHKNVLGTIRRSGHFGRLLEEIMNLDSRGIVERGPLQTVMDENVIRHSRDFESKRFLPLTDEPSEPLSVDDLIDALQPAFWRIKHVAATAWGEHIPFIFWLFALIRPRRFVELGVHSGASFLAACQTVDGLGIGCECVAIDNWIGDCHAGKHEQRIFSDSRDSLTHSYKDFAGYIRTDFDQAAKNFSEKSIDLLHIDGFHTAAAIRNDFGTWIHKLPDQGVILFHDINEFREDFGVWRFWRKIQEEYPSIEFGHEHGLGVLLVGQEGAFRKDVRNMPQGLTSNSANEVLQVLFGNIGRLSWQRVTTEQQLANIKQQLTNTEQQLADTEQQLADTKNHNVAPAIREAADQQRQRAYGALLQQCRLTRVPLLGRSAHWRRAIIKRKTAFLESSGLFDAEWYLRQNIDVAEAGVDPLEHYIEHGFDEGRTPNALVGKAYEAAC